MLKYQDQDIVHQTGNVGLQVCKSKVNKNNLLYQQNETSKTKIDETF